MKLRAANGTIDQEKRLNFVRLFQQHFESFKLPSANRELSVLSFFSENLIPPFCISFFFSFVRRCLKQPSCAAYFLKQKFLVFATLNIFFLYFNRSVKAVRCQRVKPKTGSKLSPPPTPHEPVTFLTERVRWSIRFVT